MAQSLSSEELFKEVQNRLEEIGDEDLIGQFGDFVSDFKLTVRLLEKDVRIETAKPIPSETTEKVYRYSLHKMDVDDILIENNPEWIRNNKIRCQGEDYILIMHKDKEYYGFTYDPEAGECSQDQLKLYKTKYDFLK